MPFASVSGQQTYFSFDALEQRLGLLRGLINSRDKIILVIGEQGIGKTTFLSQFLQTSHLKWKGCRLRLGCETSIASIHTGCVYVLHSKPHQTILIDDAHLLEPADLKALLIKVVRNANEGLINRPQGQTAFERDLATNFIFGYQALNTIGTFNLFHLDFTK